MSEREILFRGKDLQEQNGWLYGYFYKSDINKRERESGKATLIFTPDCDTFIYVPEYHNSWMVKAETVGQYTGLKDKNGLTKIFEGDIVKQEFSKFRQSTNGICEFHDGSFGLKIKDLGIEKFLPFACICNATYKVIGNIYDNPELLKGE